MQLIGFVLFCIGIMIVCFSKKIVRGKTKLEMQDEEELKLLTAGAVIAVKIAGSVTAAIGLAFLAIGNGLY